MSVLVLPKLHYKYRVWIVVVHANLVGKASDLPERFAAPCQMTHQFVPLTWDGAKGAYIHKGHSTTVVGPCIMHTAP